jgi:hypothetical protein
MKMEKNVIKIHDNNTQETGTYTVWLMNPKPFGDLWIKRECSEAFVNGMLNMRQKEDFFMGKHIFNVDDSDMQTLLDSHELSIVKSKYEA